MNQFLADVTVPTSGFTSIEFIGFLLAGGIMAAAAIALWRAVPKWVLVLATVIIMALIFGIKLG